MVLGVERKPGLLRNTRTLAQRWLCNAAELCPLIPDTNQLVLTIAKGGSLLRTLGEFEGARDRGLLREPALGLRCHLEDLGWRLSPVYDLCRVLPQGDEQPTDRTPRA